MRKKKRFFEPYDDTYVAYNPLDPFYENEKNAIYDGNREIKRVVEISHAEIERLAKAEAKVIASKNVEEREALKKERETLKSIALFYDNEVFKIIQDCFYLEKKMAELKKVLEMVSSLKCVIPSYNEVSGCITAEKSLKNARIELEKLLSKSREPVCEIEQELQRIKSEADKAKEKLKSFMS